MNKKVALLLIIICNYTLYNLYHFMYCKYLSQNYFLHISAQYYQNLYTNYYYYLQQCNLEKSSLNSNLYGCKSNLHYYKQNLAQCRKTNLDTTISIARTTPSTTKIETTTSSEKCMIILMYFFGFLFRY